MFNDILDAIPVPAFLIAPDDAILAMNDACRKIFPRAQLGRNYLTMLRQPSLVDLVESVKSGSRSAAVELDLSGQSQGTYRATGGALERNVLICLQDINETATAIQMRQNFIADLSHELKTPLTGISGILETSAGDAGALAHFLPALTDEVDRMKRLVADLLTLSRVESNEMRTPNQTVHLQAAVQEACTPLALRSQAAGIDINFDLPEEPIHFQGDHSEIVRAIKNLVENGLCYGVKGGQVTIRGAYQSPKTNRQSNHAANSVLIEVSNDGPGVDTHHISRLTERFYRIDAHRARNTGGSGLGLAIVKHVVNHHRGRMTIESPDNKGFHVSLTIPVKQKAS